MAKNNDKINTIRSTLPYITPVVLAVSIIVTFVRSQGDIDQLKTDYVKILKVDAAQDDEIDQNENDIIGMKINIAQILKTQGEMIVTEKENTKAIIEAIGRVKDGN